MRVISLPRTHDPLRHAFAIDAMLELVQAGLAPLVRDLAAHAAVVVGRRAPEVELRAGRDQARALMRPRR